MYMNPTIPIVTPVLQPLVETFVKENVIAKDAVRLILMIVLVTAISATVGLLLHKRMKKQWLRTNKTVALLLSAVMAIALSIRFGLSIYTFQGLFLYYLLLFASASDLTDRRVADHLSVSVLALSLISVPTVGIISMLIGGAVSFAIQTGVSVTKQRDVDNAIQDIMGIDRTQFLQIAMIAQGDFLKLLLASTGERQNIFRQIFKTQLYQDLQEKLKAE